MQSDLISKQALIKFIDKKVVPELLLHDNVSGAGVMAGFSKVLEEMDVFPTIDAVQVVHGRWIDNTKLIEGFPDYRFNCSECDYAVWRARLDRTRYCPNCGARMDGGAQE